MVDAKPIIWPIVRLGCSLVIVGALQPQVAATPHQITIRQVHSEIYLSPPSPFCSLNLHMRGFVPEVSCVCCLVWGSDDPSLSHLPLTESLLFKLIMSRFQFQSTMKYNIFTISPDVNWRLWAELDRSEWSGLLHFTPLSTPARGNQYILCMSAFSHRVLGTEQSTCSLINQWRAKSTWLPDYNQ